MVKPAVIGKDGRTTAIRNALLGSPLVKGEVPYLSEGKKLADPRNFRELLETARAYSPDFVFIGPEEPLAAGVVDALETKLGIRCIGPSQSLARLESSKAFTRDLLSRYNIPGSPEYRIFKTLDNMEQYLTSLRDGFVIKPDGLTGGKGVKVSGAHLPSVEDGVAYAAELLSVPGSSVVVEEKLDGEEFSLQSFCDGSTVVDMPIIQDHKRAYDGDEGPNTGGMGSYSCPNHRLPFLTNADVETASEINAAVADALFRETGEKYKGILYGGFMVTKNGIRLIEYNARFGDPEALNVLSLLQNDFAEICVAILEERLNRVSVGFKQLATVCKYVVPNGYPDHPVMNRHISLAKVPRESEHLRHYVAALDEHKDGFYLRGSRAIAFVGLGGSLQEAEARAEEAASAVEGPVYHRKDIGTIELIERRIEHVRKIRSTR